MLTDLSQAARRIAVIGPMRWQAKLALQRTCDALPAGQLLSRFATDALLGTARGHLHKLCRAIPHHLTLLRDVVGIPLEGARMGHYGAGATPVSALILYLATGSGGVLLDRWHRPQDRYLSPALALVQQKAAAEWAGLLGLPPGRVQRLGALLPLRRVAELFTALGTVSCAPGPFSTLTPGQKAPWPERGLHGIFSGGELEHLDPEALSATLSAMREALRPGGACSLVIDHRDHLWHSDKSRSPMQHLSHGDLTQRLLVGQGLCYHNRLLCSDYQAALVRAGLRAVATYRMSFPSLSFAGRDQPPRDPPPLSRTVLAPRFRHRGDGDLATCVSHFVAIRD